MDSKGVVIKAGRWGVADDLCLHFPQLPQKNQSQLMKIGGMGTHGTCCQITMMSLSVFACN